MIGIFVADIAAMVAFYPGCARLRHRVGRQRAVCEFKHEGVRFSMYARTELPGLLASADLSWRPQRHVRAGN